MTDRGGAMVRGVIFLAILAIATWLVVSSADNWGDWVVLGAIVVTAIGGGMAVHHREYTTRRRTFVRTTRPPR